MGAETGSEVGAGVTVAGAIAAAAVGATATAAAAGAAGAAGAASASASDSPSARRASEELSLAAGVAKPDNPHAMTPSEPAEQRKKEGQEEDGSFRKRNQKVQVGVYLENSREDM